MVRHLETGETFAHREDEPQATASLIKFPVMIEAYRQSVEEKLDLTQPVTLQDADKVQGSGILTTHFSAGATFPLRDAIRLMIAYSDNTATNLVLDKIGLPATAATMEKLECPHTKIHAKVFRRETSVFPERSKEFGLGSTTAAEMIRLCELLHQEKLVSPEASRADAGPYEGLRGQAEVPAALAGRDGRGVQDRERQRYADRGRHPLQQRGPDRSLRAHRQERRSALDRRTTPAT